MITKIKLIKTYPNSPPLGTEYIYNERYNSFYPEPKSLYTHGLYLTDADKDPEYYELTHEAKFKVRDYVTNLNRTVVDFIKSIYVTTENEYIYTLDNDINNTYLEENLKIADNTVFLFDKTYFKHEIIWKCLKNGRKAPNQITILNYLQNVKSDNIQHFEIFQTEAEANDWFLENGVRYSTKDLRSILNVYSKIECTYVESVMQSYLKSL